MKKNIIFQKIQVIIIAEPVPAMAARLGGNGGQIPWAETQSHRQSFFWFTAFDSIPETSRNLGLDYLERYNAVCQWGPELNGATASAQSVAQLCL